MARQAPTGRKPPAKGKRTQGKKGPRATGDMPMAHTVFDANHPNHMPLPMMVTPYVVQRFVTNITIAPSASNNTYAIISPYLSTPNSSFNLTASVGDIVALLAAGPTTIAAASLFTMADITNLFVTGLGGSPTSNCEMAISALSCSLTCTSSLNNSAGLVWMGKSTAPIDLALGTPTFDTVFGTFIGRNDIRPISYSQLYTSHGIHATPMDFVSFESFYPVAARGSPFPSGTVCHHGMTPLVLVFSPATGGTTSYNLRITMEARVRYPISSANYTMHSKHKPTPQGLYNKIVGEAEDIIGGVVNEAESILGMGARRAAGMAARRATRGALG